MKIGKSLVLFTLMIFAFCAASSASTKDSVGVKVKNGKIFVMHKVEPGQGLFSVSRRYNVPIKDIVAANPELGDVLQKDQIILIPTGKDAPFEEQTVKEYFDDKDNHTTESNTTETKVSSTFARYHTVSAGETLFAIATKYNTSVTVIKNLNDLSSDVLSVGQKLLVPVAEEAAESEEDRKDEEDKKAEQQRKSELEAELERLRNRINGTQKATNADSMIVNEDEAVVENKEYSKEIQKVAKYDVEEVVEKGEVQIFSGNSVDQVQRFASHHEAEIGTVIMITNPENGESVFVKVIKNHNLNEDRTNMILITKSAADLVAVQNGSPVEISYAR